MAKIKIISTDGTTKNTAVVDAQTDEPIEGVTSVSLSLVNGEWIAEIAIAKPEIDFTVDSFVKATK